LCKFFQHLPSKMTVSRAKTGGEKHEKPEVRNMTKTEVKNEARRPGTIPELR
jgi:hypothetical protein